MDFQEVSFKKFFTLKLKNNLKGGLTG